MPYPTPVQVLVFRFLGLTFLLALVLPLASQPLSAIRNKISAGDLYSAESLLEVHRDANGQDGVYLQGLAWLARGALLTGFPQEAARYAASARQTALQQIDERGFEASPDATNALGAALEVEAQLLHQQSAPDQAAAFLAEQLRLYPKAPPALRARLYKRINLLTLEGSLAPEVTPQHLLAQPFPTLDALRGKTVVLFFWAEWCGDCHAQAAALRTISQEFANQGVAFQALTRFYKEGGDAELARIRKQWTQHYGGLENIPVAISSPAMERYGISSTPTFVIIGKSGNVIRYLPYRLTTERLRKEIQQAQQSSAAAPAGTAQHRGSLSPRYPGTPLRPAALLPE